MNKIFCVLFALFVSSVIFAQSNYYYDEDNVIQTIEENKLYIDWTDHQYIYITDKMEKTIKSDSLLDFDNFFEEYQDATRKNLLDLIGKTKLGSQKNIDKDSITRKLNFAYWPIIDKTDNKMNLYYKVKSNMSQEQIIEEKNKYLVDLAEKFKVSDNKKTISVKNVKYTELPDNLEIKIYASKEDFSFIKKNEDKKTADIKFDPEKPITGLVIDTKGLGLECSVCPKIRLSNGDVIYCDALRLNDLQDTLSTVSFVKQLPKEVTLTDNPIVITAINIAKEENGAYTDIVVSDLDAWIIQQYYENVKIMTEKNIYKQNKLKFSYAMNFNYQIINTWLNKKPEMGYIFNFWPVKEKDYPFIIGI